MRRIRWVLPVSVSRPWLFGCQYRRQGDSIGINEPPLQVDRDRYIRKFPVLKTSCSRPLQSWWKHARYKSLHFAEPEFKPSTPPVRGSPRIPGARSIGNAVAARGSTTIQPMAPDVTGVSQEEPDCWMEGL